VGHAQATVTWDGVTHSTWTQPDSTTWSGATYQSGDTAVFAGAVDRQRLRVGIERFLAPHRVAHDLAAQGVAVEPVAGLLERCRNRSQLCRPLRDQRRLGNERAYLNMETR
jgi:hypothetical protein